MTAEDDEETRRCQECGGLTRCSGEEHRYWTAADARQPARTLSPLWRDPLIERAP